MLTINDIDKFRAEIEGSTKKRIQLETEIDLIKKSMKENYGVDNTADADSLIKELEIEQEKIKKQIETKLTVLNDAMKKDGLI